MTAPEHVDCRRCERPLRTARSRRKGIGPKCERLEAEENAGYARRPPSRPGEDDEVITGFPELVETS
ncbi:hypothetical protein GCM10027258_63030 [Amycolatopsis stemonae]